MFENAAGKFSTYAEARQKTVEQDPQYLSARKLVDRAVLVKLQLDRYLIHHHNLKRPNLQRAQ
jgi:hypothetical protein